MRVTPFTAALEPRALRELSQRLEAARWPRPPACSWQWGVEADWLTELVQRWRRRTTQDLAGGGLQRRLDAEEHLLVQVEPDTAVHVLRRRARSGAGTALLLTHGWPSAFTEYLPALDALSDPAAHGLPGPGFDVVLASLPGYGFSSRPDHPLPYDAVAAVWGQVMEALGYDRYGVGGTDFGAGVASCLARQRPEAVTGVHLSTLELEPSTGPGHRPLSAAERDWQQRSDAWWASEGGYKQIAATKPATLAYALSDSPLGLAAWVGEKWWSWSDPRARAGGCLPAPVMEALLDVLTVYWTTGCVGTTLRDYTDNRAHPLAWAPGERVEVPTAVALFADPAGDPPREWAERLYAVRRWTPMPEGGHFAAAEQPGAFARDVCEFFASST